MQPIRPFLFQADNSIKSSGTQVNSPLRDLADESVYSRLVARRPKRDVVPR